MRIARLDGPEGPRHAVWTGEAWKVVADCFADLWLAPECPSLPMTPTCWHLASREC